MTLIPPAFRTDSVAPADRIALWEEWNAHSLFGLRCTTVQGDLSLSSGQVTVDGLKVTEVHGTPHIVDRSGPMLKRVQGDSLHVSVLLNGRGFFHGPNGTSVLRAGEAMAYRTTDPHMFGFDTELQLLIVDVPMETLQLEWGWDAPSAPELLGAERVAGLHSILTGLGGDGQSPPVPGALTELTRAALRPHSASPLATYLRALRVLRTQLSDPDLTPESLAAQLGLSSRQLHRVFAAQDTSPGRSILLERLLAAKDELEHRQDLSVTDISGRWGFSSPAHFSRAYRREFEASPSQVRQASRGSD